MINLEMGLLGTCVGFFEGGEIEFGHLPEGFEHALEGGWIIGFEPALQLGGPDLPAHAEFVFQPSAGEFGTTIGDEAFPECVDFGLGIALDGQRKGFGKFPILTGVEGDHFQPAEFKFNGEEGLVGGVENFADDFGVGDDGNVKFSGLFGLVGVGEERGDAMLDVHDGISRWGVEGKVWWIMLGSIEQDAIDQVQASKVQASCKSRERKSWENRSEAKREGPDREFLGG